MRRTLYMIGQDDRVWRVVLDPFPFGDGQLGHCRAPWVPDDEREIRIRSNLPDRLLLDTVLHEVLHAHAWALDEEVVDAFGSAAADLLWRLGYRRVAE